MGLFIFWLFIIIAGHTRGDSHHFHHIWRSSSACFRHGHWQVPDLRFPRFHHLLPEHVAPSFRYQRSDWGRLTSYFPLNGKPRTQAHILIFWKWRLEIVWIFCKYVRFSLLFTTRPDTRQTMELVEITPSRWRRMRLTMATCQRNWSTSKV